MMESQSNKKEQSTNDYSEILKQKDKKIKQLQKELEEACREIEFDEALLEMANATCRRMIDTFHKFSNKYIHNHND